MKNRTVIGIICIVLAVVMTFVISPVVNKMTEGKEKVICFSKDIPHGSEISEEDIDIIPGAYPQRKRTEKKRRS